MVCAGQTSVWAALTRMAKRPSGATRSTDERVAPLGDAFRKLREGNRRDVEAHDIEARTDQRHIIAAVATADVEAAGDAGLTRGGQDIVEKRLRRLGIVTPGLVLSVPGAGAFTPHAARRSLRLDRILPGRRPAPHSRPRSPSCRSPCLPRVPRLVAREQPRRRRLARSSHLLPAPIPPR